MENAIKLLFQQPEPPISCEQEWDILRALVLSQSHKSPYFQSARAIEARKIFLGVCKELFNERKPFTCSDDSTILFLTTNNSKKRCSEQCVCYLNSESDYVFSVRNYFYTSLILGMTGKDCLPF